MPDIISLPAEALRALSVQQGDSLRVLSLEGEQIVLEVLILLDVLLARPMFAVESEAVVQRCDALNAEIFIAWHSLATAYYLLKRGRSENDALAEIDRILAWVSVATTTDQSARRARHLGLEDFEDIHSVSFHAVRTK